MTDREMLEMAAKAAGVEMLSGEPIVTEGEQWREWNPKDDDGDALRLAVKLRLCVFYAHSHACVSRSKDEEEVEYIGLGKGVDPAAATRLAILRAAAQIGKEMK